jgi:hydrogenase maturation factor
VTCEDDRCITCGDIAVAATVVEVVGSTATVELDGAREQVGIDVVGPVGVGEVLLCHAGIAIDKVEVAP